MKPAWHRLSPQHAGCGMYLTDVCIICADTLATGVTAKYTDQKILANCYVTSVTVNNDQCKEICFNRLSACNGLTMSILIPNISDKYSVQCGVAGTAMLQCPKADDGGAVEYVTGLWAAEYGTWICGVQIHGFRDWIYFPPILMSTVIWHHHSELFGVNLNKSNGLHYGRDYEYHVKRSCNM